ncbi:hypothetical protein [Bizionia myxarmorum]|uniref:Uncharacterized protein n=1 Tax=Bizionia myxarmorum TaxID=291186 RepID=A0A5D0REL5_9FLAO|nr:hypothetical protein [Bizionia myxarmorum]TYB79396.1 hypothetical protein ES674_06380 [Bizionia myxarmorum]
MRKTIFTLLPMLLLIFMVVSCEDDEDLTGDNNDKIVLTTENNLYEGDLYVIYLEEEIDDTQNTILMLQQMIENGEGTAEIELQLSESEAQLQILNDNLAYQIGIEVEYLLPPRKPRRPPNPPPPPSPCIGCVPLEGNFSYLTITPDITNITIRFLDYNTEAELEVVNFNVFNPSEDYNGVVSIQPASLNNFKGQVIIIVERQDVNDVKTSYSLNARFY